MIGLGKLVKVAHNQNEIYLGELNPGVYYYLINQGANTARGRVVKIESN